MRPLGEGLADGGAAIPVAYSFHDVGEGCARHHLEPPAGIFRRFRWSTVTTEYPAPTGPLELSFQNEDLVAQRQDLGITLVAAHQ